MSDPASQAAARHFDATIEFLRELIGINSFTANPAGIRATAERIAAQFEPLGFTATYEPATDPAHGPHLALHRPGIAGAPTLALISHLDTVFTAEEETLYDFHFRRQGSRLYGPGANDIKGGTAMIWQTLLTLRDLAPELFASVHWFVLHNACEEVISNDFERLCRAVLPADTLACLIFEADGGSGQKFSLVRSRKGRAVCRISVEGRASHAGSDHRHGINAITHLAGIVSAVAALTDYDAGVTVNVGTIRGGTVLNRVPHEASAELEIRAFAPDVYARTKDHLLRHASADWPKVDVRFLDETRPWPRNPQTEALFQVWAKSAADLGLPLQSEDRGGLSDGNALWDVFPTLDGLGPRGENCHCSERSADGSKDQEWVDGESFVPKAALNTHAIRRLIEQAGAGRV